MHDIKKNIKIALVGNPNCGKTTLFNQLTGSNQYVGNWPGVTVEKKVGRIKNSESDMYLIDLPGIYSLSPYSQDEVVSRDCLLDDNPDIILNIIDATNIERNLYLTTQILELGCPVIVVVNMVNLLEKQGGRLNYRILQNELHVPVIPVSANKGTGITDILLTIKSVLHNGESRISPKIYCDKLEHVLSSIDSLIHNKQKNKKVRHDRFYSVRIFEDDKSIMHKLDLEKEDLRKITQYCTEFNTNHNWDKEMIIADQRYNYIRKIGDLSVKKKNVTGGLTLSDKIDRVVTNKYLAIPIFVSILLAIFTLTFGPFGNMLRDSAQKLINDDFGNVTLMFLKKLGASEWACSLVVNGVIAGLGSIVSFLPQVSILFLFLSILEDSGYMARGSFIMDHLLRKVGLSGKAFVSLLMGFGCTVPAVLGTRTLGNDRDRRLAIIITPFMSCSAKMPVYALFVSTFFKNYQPVVILSIYLIGILVGILSSVFFKNSILKGQTTPFIMEMPPYHMPTIKNLFLHVWDRVKDFITKAGTVLLGATIIIWFLQSFDVNFKMVSDSSQSILASLGTFIAPIFTLCGFGDWKSSVALLTGVVAKESVVSTLAILNGGNLYLQSELTSVFTPLSAYSFMVFVLLYTPCIAALSAIRKEIKSIKLTVMIITYQLFVAWFVSAMFFQFGRLFSHIDFIIGFLSVIVVLSTIVSMMKSAKTGRCSSCDGHCDKCELNLKERGEKK